MLQHRLRMPATSAARVKPARLVVPIAPLVAELVLPLLLMQAQTTSGPHQ